MTDKSRANSVRKNKFFLSLGNFYLPISSKSELSTFVMILRNKVSKIANYNIAYDAKMKD